jgi:hypothetical protein
MVLEYDYKRKAGENMEESGSGPFLHSLERLRKTTGDIPQDGR